MTKNKNQYGILYGKTNFPKGHRLEWLNYAGRKYPMDLTLRIKDLSEYVNTKYSDKIIIPLDNTLKPGIVCEPEVIEEIANFVYNSFNDIFIDLIGEGDIYTVVWSIGVLDSPEKLIKQGKIISRIPTLHHLPPYPVIVKVGQKLDKLRNKPGIFRV